MSENETKQAVDKFLRKRDADRSRASLLNSYVYGPGTIAPGQQVFLRNPLQDPTGSAQQRENLSQFMRGRAAGTFSWAPDLIGQLSEGPVQSYYGPGAADVRQQIVDQGIDLPLQNERIAPFGDPLSGDPIREFFGVDPENVWASAGEFFDHMGAIQKAPAMAAKGIGFLAKTLGTHPSFVSSGLSAFAGKAMPASLATVLATGEGLIHHGSPFDFRIFSRDYENAGTGGAAFTRGLYFTQSEGLARTYIPPTPHANQVIEERMSTDLMVGDREAASYWREARDGATPEQLRAKGTHKAAVVADELESILEGDLAGHLYSVKIKPGVLDELYEWNKPFDQQPTKVQSILREAGVSEMAPDELQEWMRAGGDETLENLKMRGVKYVESDVGMFPGDENVPRGEGMNFVIYDPDDITEVYRDGDLVWSAAKQAERRASEAAKRGISIHGDTAMSLDERIQKYLLPEEHALMTKNDRDVMEQLLAVTASPQEVAAMAAAGGAKRGWYQESVKAIRHVFGDDAEQFAALLAAMSPQTSVESNLRNALNVWKNWTLAGRPRDAEQVLDIMAMSVERTPLDKLDNKRLNKMARRAEQMLGVDIPTAPGTMRGRQHNLDFLQSLPDEIQGRLSILPAWEKNSLRALLVDPNAGGSPLRHLSGPKVNSFWQNLIGQMDEVTQDTWMARALGMNQNRHFGGRPKKGFEDEVGSLGVKKPGYFAGNILVREAADIMSQATGEKWTPAEIQETVWSWAKALYESKGAKGEMRSIPEILQAGDVGDDIIRDVPDFDTLFQQDNEFRQILEEAGYGRQLETLPESGFGARGAVGLDAGSERYLESAAERLDRTSVAKGSGTAEDIRQLTTGRFSLQGDAKAGVSQPFRRRANRPRRGVLEGQDTQLWTLPDKERAKFNRLGVGTPSIYETTDANAFYNSLANARESNRFGRAVTLYPQEEYANMRLFLTQDGTAGFALKPDGDIVSVFNTKGGPHRAVTPYLLSLAIEQGGYKLDAYDIGGGLPFIYRMSGFDEVNRFKWDEQYRPDDWDDALGTPDVVMMEIKRD